MSHWRPVAAVLLVWCPYIASTGLQERAGVQSALGPALMLVAALMIWPAARLIGRADPFALRFDRRIALLFGVTFAAGVVVQLLHWLIGRQMGILAIASIADGALPLGILAMATLSTFVPSLTEDVLTRGFPLFALRWQRLTGPVLILFSAALYVANHLWRFDWGWTEQLRLGAMGIAFAVAAWRTQSLWPAVGLHWGGNLAPAIGGSFLDITPIAVGDDRLLSAALYLVLAVGIVALTRPPHRREGQLLVQKG